MPVNFSQVVIKRQLSVGRNVHCRADAVTPVRRRHHKMSRLNKCRVNEER